MTGSSSVLRKLIGSADHAADRSNVFEVTGAAMTIINFCSRFIVRGGGLRHDGGYWNVAESSDQNRRPGNLGSA
jgi:hypothetical protein